MKTLSTMLRTYTTAECIMPFARGLNANRDLSIKHHLETILLPRHRTDMLLPLCCLGICPNFSTERNKTRLFP